MKILWLVTAGLGLVYMVVWAAGKNADVSGPQNPNRPPVVKQEPVPPANVSAQALAELSRGDAISRVDPKAILTLVSSTPKAFTGTDLREVPATAAGAVPGFEVVWSASVDNKETSRLTYHVAAPNRVVFVKQEPVNQ